MLPLTDVCPATAEIPGRPKHFPYHSNADSQDSYPHEAFRVHCFLAARPQIVLSKIRGPVLKDAKRKGKNRQYADCELDAAQQAASMPGCMDQVCATQIALLDIVVSASTLPAAGHCSLAC